MLRSFDNSGILFCHLFFTTQFARFEQFNQSANKTCFKVFFSKNECFTYGNLLLLASASSIAVANSFIVAMSSATSGVPS